MKRWMRLHVVLVVMTLVGVTARDALAASKTVGDIAFTAPARWEETAVTSSMRKAQFRVPRATGDAGDAELAVFYFGVGQGGSVEDNVKRWAGQFSDPSGRPVTPISSRRELNSVTVTLVQMSGTYASGMPMGPMAPKLGYGLLGAIVEGSQGPVFFKLIGPQVTIQQAHSEFDELVASFATE